MIVVVAQLLLSLAGALLIPGLTPVPWGWAPLIFVGMFLVANILYLAVLYFISLFLGHKVPEKDSRFCRFVTVRTIQWIFVMLRISVKVEGKEKLPRCPIVLVSNHRSDFDPMAVLAAMPERRIAYISKPENLRIPLAGAFVNRCSFLAIDRENPRHALVTLHEAVNLMKGQGLDIGIYPEGTRSRTGDMKPFKEGAFLMAKWAGAPIAVMTTEGTERIAGHVIVRRNRIHLRILDVIPAEEVARRSVAELTAKAETILRRSLKNGQEEK